MSRAHDASNAKNHGGWALRTKVFILAFPPQPPPFYAALFSHFSSSTQIAGLPRACLGIVHSGSLLASCTLPPAPTPTAFLQGRHPSTRARISCSKTPQSSDVFSSIDRPGNAHYSRQLTRASRKEEALESTYHLITMPPTAKKTAIAPAAKTSTAAGPARKTAAKKTAGKRASNVQRTSYTLPSPTQSFKPS
jgi:hypothetical protein